MNESSIEEIGRLLIPYLPTRYVPHAPTPTQSAFLLYNGVEAMYGGAAGGGKSDALLMAALQYVEFPNYRALLLRRTYKDLALPDALLDRAHQWLNGTGARWIDLEKTWKFPSGATLTFGFLEHEKDKYRYQGAQFQFVGFDELTQFTETQFLYLFSRLRKLKDSPIPLRMRAATNPPDDADGEWVKRRYIDHPEDRIFVRAKLADNPHLDPSYVASLDRMDHITRARLKDGDWDVHRVGKLFKREWFPISYVIPTPGRAIRAWDLAGTEGGGDFTAGARLTRSASGLFVITDIQRAQLSPGRVEVLVKETARMDGFGTVVSIEQEPGQSGKAQIEHYKTAVLPDYMVEASHPSGPKEVRAGILSSYGEHGKVVLLPGSWNEALWNQLELFPFGPNDDLIDAVVYALLALVKSVEWDLL